MKKLDRNHCKKKSECWCYDYMVEHKFSTENIYEVCRKCMHFKKSYLKKGLR